LALADFPAFLPGLMGRFYHLEMRLA